MEQGLEVAPIEGRSRRPPTRKGRWSRGMLKTVGKRREGKAGRERELGSRYPSATRRTVRLGGNACGGSAPAQRGRLCVGGKLWRVHGTGGGAPGTGGHGQAVDRRGHGVGEARSAKTRTTLGSAAGCNKPAGQTEDRAAEVVRNDASGVRSGVAPRCTRRTAPGNRAGRGGPPLGPGGQRSLTADRVVEQTLGCLCR